MGDVVARRSEAMAKGILAETCAVVPIRVMRRIRFLPFLALLTGAGCSQTFAPGPHSSDVLYVFGSGSSLFVIDPATGRVVARPGPVPDGKRSPVFSADSSTLYFEAGDANGSAIYALNTRTFGVEPWFPLRDIRHVPNDSLWIGGGELAVGPGVSNLYDGQAILIDRSVSSPFYIQRVVSIDTGSRTVTASLGPIYSAELVTLPAGPVAPRGALLALVPGRGHSVLGWLVVIDPATNAVTDSIALPMPAPNTFDEALHIVPSPDGRHVYVTGLFGMYAYDLESRQLLTALSFPSYDARIAVSPNGSSVYLISNPRDFAPQIVGGGGHPQPTPLPPLASTAIRVFDANLIEQSPISFAHVFSGRTKLVLRDAVVSRDNQWLYATGSNTTSYADGTLRVLIIKLATGTITHDLSLGISGQGRLFVGH